MYQISKVVIDGFWDSQKVEASFFDDVNIIIGKNGSGKTTFMNILQAVLSVDVDAIFDNSFSSISIKLKDDNRTKTIKAIKSEEKGSPFPAIEYYISGKKYHASLIVGDDIRSFPLHMRRRSLEEAQKIRIELEKIVFMTSLSVYRIGGEIEQDGRDRLRRLFSPVDQRLNNLSQRLTHYQLELSNQARTVSISLQREVLTSLLYNKSQKQTGYTHIIDEISEKDKLVSAYKQLGVSGAETTKKINDHISECSKAANSLNAYFEKKSDVSDINWVALDAFRLTSKVVEMSLEAESHIKMIYSQLNSFFSILKKFIQDKKFEIVGGDLTVRPEKPIPLFKLSSGEKQLLILLIETLLQRQRGYIFLADEPELSLHIAWQQNIISAIKSLNPNAQVIVATHSPEIAGKYRHRIFNMEEMVHG